MVKTIYASKGEVILVDDNDYEWLNQYAWYTNSTKYAMRSAWVKGKAIKYRMHREIMGLSRKVEGGVVVDHIDGNPLNNQRSNLRVVTHSGNYQNRKPPANKHGYTGVNYHKLNRVKPWEARITVNGKRISLGSYATAEEAYCAYLEAKAKYHIPCPRFLT